MQIHIAKNGQRMGPYEEAQVREMLAAGTIAGTDLAWHEGMADWKPVSTVLAPASTAPSAVTAPTAAPQTVAPAAMIAAIIDPNLAGRGVRLCAVIIDGLITGLCFGPGLAVIFTGGDDNDTTKIIGGLVISLAVLVLAVVQIYLLTTRGQTIGKKMMSVKIVKYADSSNPGFVHACLLRLIVPSLLSCIPFVGSMFQLVDACFIFQMDRRCIHDLIAGTKVVNA